MGEILRVENLSKQYRLGEVGTGTLSHDLNRWWAKIRGKEDPFLTIGEKNDRANSGQSSYVWALQNINFSVNSGEVLGIIGKNGAGKSTLLKVLSKVTGPSKGRILSKGRIAALLEVGTGFHPELTGRENVFLNGAILGMTKKEIASKFDEIVHFAGVGRYVDTPVKRYSSGMMVRLGFAVAAHLEPEILIVDEVLAVGDIEFQNKCIGKMSEVSKSGRTVLFVSHNMASVRALCERCLVIDQGEVAFDGSVDMAIRKYLDSSIQDRGATIDKFDSKMRKGNQVVRVSKIGFHKGATVTNRYMIGDDMRISFEIEGDFSSTVLGMSFYLYNSEEVMISNVENVDCGVALPRSKGKYRFDLVFNDLRLYPGEYKIGYWIGSQSSYEDFDKMDICGSFFVIEGSDKVKRDISNSKCLLFLTPDWEVNES